jgi:NAD(P)-dependent dehydrogenase (short-subunit alcohol dehydrogenase family)
LIADLKNKNVLLTGAGNGIGRGIAIIMASQGANLFITDIDLQAADQTLNMSNSDKSYSCKLDVTAIDSITNAVNKCIDQYGNIDILVNNAGIPEPQNPSLSKQEIYDLVMDVNLTGTVNCTEAVIPYMKKQKYGKIINIASIAGLGARRTGGVYTLSKAGVIRYTKGLAVELGGYNINVNSISPGAVWTDFQKNTINVDKKYTDKDAKNLFEKRYVPMMPLGRTQSPEDIGNLAAFLASDDACNITGQNINVDSGAVIE